MYFRCNTTVGNVPQAPPFTYLVPNLTTEPVKELQNLTYVCNGLDNKVYIEDNPTNTFHVLCLPGGVWYTPLVSEWPMCSDPTTTTEPPTTTTPVTSKLSLNIVDYWNMDVIWY